MISWLGRRSICKVSEKRGRSTRRRYYIRPSSRCRMKIMTPETDNSREHTTPESTLVLKPGSHRPACGVYLLSGLEQSTQPVVRHPLHTKLQSPPSPSLRARRSPAPRKDFIVPLQVPKMGAKSTCGTAPFSTLSHARLAALHPSAPSAKPSGGRPHVRTFSTYEQEVTTTEGQSVWLHGRRSSACGARRLPCSLAGWGRNVGHNHDQSPNFKQPLGRHQHKHPLLHARLFSLDFPFKPLPSVLVGRLEAIAVRAS